MAEKSIASEPNQVNIVNDQPPPYSPRPQPGPSVTYVTTGPVIVQPVRNVSMVTHTAYFTCTTCNAEVRTKIKAKPTMKTHLFALLLCMVGFWPCVAIPYCVDTCQRLDHYCPDCNAYLGSSNL